LKAAKEMPREHAAKIKQKINVHLPGASTATFNPQEAGAGCVKK